IADAETEMLQFIREKHPQIREAIVSSKDLASDTEAQLKDALTEFAAGFIRAQSQATVGAGA
ncbi:MAG: hypothetical protein KDA81_22685, partial [Planctomycetaceae bacterium]|nr:hypothetical protein [Planctomycetaceae bacterium]